VISKIKALITEIMILEKKDVQNVTLLREELECTDIDLYDIIRTLEDEFDITINDNKDSILECETVEDIENLIAPYVYKV